MKLMVTGLYLSISKVITGTVELI